MMSMVAPMNSREEVYEWLRVQAEKLGLRVLLLTGEAGLQNGWLYLPVHIEDVTDAYDNALKLQQLEDTWNDRDPQPETPLFLIPAKDPLRQATWERVSNALQRKMKALEAFGNATSREEQEKAAAEFQNAEQAEDGVHRAYGNMTPQISHVS
jgi:hypothetical protein